MKNKAIKRVAYYTLSCVLILLCSCQKGPSDPTSINAEDFPVAPINLKVGTGDRTISVSWVHPAPQGVASFKIYRQDTVNVAFSHIGTTSSMTFLDTNLQNGLEYRYRVTSVGTNGLEGQASVVISAIPAIFSVLINSGSASINSRTVTLSFGAPSRTTLMRIWNDTLFTNSGFENFSSTKSWQLSPGDGEKRVSVIFRDARDRETLEPVTATILLDTRARIRQLTHNATGRVLFAADSVHIIMLADEPRGQAQVNINNIQQGIQLFDNGANGDRVAGDGVYEGDYVVPAGPEAESTLMVGFFTDLAGNVAPSVNASGRLTIRQPPTPVNLILVEAVIGSQTQLNLFWSQNNDADFSNYRIYRQTTAGITTQSPLVTIIQDRTKISFTDTNLAPNTTYFYKIFVFDQTGLFFGSNERNGTTDSN